MAVIELYTKQATHACSCILLELRPIDNSCRGYKDRPLVKLAARMNGCHQASPSSIMVGTYNSKNG